MAGMASPGGERISCPSEVNSQTRLVVQTGMAKTAVSSFAASKIGCDFRTFLNLWVRFIIQQTEQTVLAGFLG
jgi:hypothetical protein